MKVGQRAVVQPERLFKNHPAIRFHNPPAATSLFAPRGASGQVLEISGDGSEALVEIYWNPNPRTSPLSGEAWRFWIKREWFGQLLVP